MSYFFLCLPDQFLFVLGLIKVLWSITLVTGEVNGKTPRRNKKGDGVTYTTYIQTRVGTTFGLKIDRKQ